MLEIKKINKAFGQKKVLKDASFNVKPNQIIALLGRNGSGKSTILKILCDLILPDSGEIIKTSKNQKISYVSTSERSFFHRLSVLENLEFFSSFEISCPQQRQELINEKLDKIGLSGKAKQKYFSLSSGEKKKLSIVRALLRNPTLLLLDEYSASLDYASRLEAKEMLIDLLKQNLGMSIIFSTHFFDEVEDFATDMLLLNQNGHIKHHKVTSSISDLSLRRTIIDGI